MADRNYLKQPQGDADATDAAKHTVIHSISIAADSLSPFYFVGNARHVYWIAEKSNCVAVIRGQGGAGAPTNVYAAYKNGTATPIATAYSAADTPETPGQLRQTICPTSLPSVTITLLAHQKSPCTSTTKLGLPRYPLRSSSFSRRSHS